MKALLIIFAIVHASIIFAEDGPDLEGIAAVIEAKNDYQRVLIEAKLAESEIALNLAKAKFEHTKVKHIELYMSALRHEFERVKREEKKVEYEIERVKVYAELCSGLSIGDTRRGAFQGLRYFLRYGVPIADLKKLMGVEVTELGPENFIANDDVSEVQAFSGGNIGQLVKFAEQNDYSFMEWGDAHFAILDLMSAIVATADRKVREYQTYIDGIRAGTLNVFELPYE